MVKILIKLYKITSTGPGALERCRIIYVARNPRDLCVSYFKMMSEPESGFVGDFSQFAEFFKLGIHVMICFIK